MSLLLDALKKAEQEKAKQQQEDDAEDLLEKTGEFFQASIQEELKAEKAAEAEQSTNIPKPADTSLSLEPLSDSSEAKPETNNIPELKETPVFKAEPKVELTESLTDFNEEQVSEDTLTGLSSKDLINDIGDGFNSTPVAAQTVFRAGLSRGAKNSNIGLWLWVFCFIGLFGFIAAYFFTVKPLQKNAVNTQALIANKSSVISTETKEPEQTISEVEETAEVSTIETTDPAVTQAVITETETEIQQVTNEEPKVETVSINATEEKVTQTDTNNTSTTTIKKETRLERLPEKITPPKSGIKISKNKTSELFQQLINRAYLAFQSGNYSEAEQFYLQALKSDRTNRDVLLGLAAIALKKGDKELAYIHYLNLLDNNPGDDAAITGLLSISNKGEPKQNLQLIQSLQEKKPKASYLDYILGNQYAKLQQWPKAQQAYFNALSKDAFNPDYAFNLAVSLDQIGQYKSALNYYYSALELAEKRNASFAPGPVFSRIDTLTAEIKRIQ